MPRTSHSGALGAYHPTSEQIEEMLQSFQITAKLAEELLALPEVLEGAEVISNVPNPTVYVPEVPAGSLATVNPARTAGRAPSAVTTVAADSIPALRIVAGDSGLKTMSSLDIVDYINHIRKPGSAILRHDDFMQKVPAVLDEKAAPKFIGTAKYKNGTGGMLIRNVYNFPRKEAIRMAMSYSYDLQAAVLDAWDEAEAKVAQPVALLPNFDDPVAAAEAWITERKQSNVLKLELSTATEALVAAQPAIDFTATVKADDTMYDFGSATLYSFAYTSLLGQQSAIRQFLYRQRKLKLSLQCPVRPM